LKYNLCSICQVIYYKLHSNKIALLSSIFTDIFTSTRNRPDSYRDGDTWIFSPLLYLPIFIGMSYGTSFSDCKQKFQFWVHKILSYKIQLSHFNTESLLMLHVFNFIRHSNLSIDKKMTDELKCCNTIPGSWKIKIL
jgi:hypothetical protein